MAETLSPNNQDMALTVANVPKVQTRGTRGTRWSRSSAPPLNSSAPSRTLRSTTRTSQQNIPAGSGSPTPIPAPVITPCPRASQNTRSPPGPGTSRKNAPATKAAKKAAASSTEGPQPITKTAGQLYRLCGSEAPPDIKGIKVGMSFSNPNRFPFS